MRSAFLAALAMGGIMQISEAPAREPFADLQFNTETQTRPDAVCVTDQGEYVCWHEQHTGQATPAPAKAPPPAPTKGK